MSAFRPGDQVIAFTTYGAFAEEVKTEAVRLLPMPVDQFEQRDAFFDLSGLADRPGIDAQPMIDFFLDQMGVESAAVPAADKRNSIRLPGGVLDEVRKTTRALGSRYVVLHPLSSNFIRNMPADVFRALAARLVEATGCDVATLIPTPRVHPRMVDLSAVSRRGYPFFCALIAEAAGLVSVDTSTLKERCTVTARANDVLPLAEFTSTSMLYSPSGNGVSHQ